MARAGQLVVNGTRQSSVETIWTMWSSCEYIDEQLNKYSVLGIQLLLCVFHIQGG